MDYQAHPASQQQRLSSRAGKAIDLFNSSILAYGKDLDMYGKAAGWGKVYGIYSVRRGFIGSPIVFILSPVVFEIPTIGQSEERKRELESRAVGKAAGK